MPFLNLTSTIGSSNSLFYNTSYIIANQPPQMTTQTVWIIFALLGIGLLLFSRASTEPTCKDLAGVMAWPLLLVSAIQAFAVDVITGTTFASGTDAPVLGALIETHTIYHYDLIGVVLGIFWIIASANLYLLWLDYKRITQQEQEPVNGADVKKYNYDNQEKSPKRGGMEDEDQR